MRRLVIACQVVLLIVVQACKSPNSEQDYHSELTSITVGLPDRSPLKARVPDIETKMNAYQLWVTPVDASCLGATKINLVGNYLATADVLDFKLQQGCDYDVTLALGNKAASGNALSASYFRNATALRITKESIAGRDQISADITVQLTTEGKSLGL